MADQLSLYDAQDSGIAQPIIVPLGVDSGSGGIDPGAGVSFTYGVAGIGFLSATSDENPYQRGLKNVLKDQVNNSEQPGDQSFTDWWYRSQTDWSSGSGVRFMEPITDKTIQSSFYESVGVDVWTPGQVSLLPAAGEVAELVGSGNTSHIACVVTNSGVFSEWSADRTYVATGREVAFYYGDSWTKVTVLGNAHLSVGEYVTSLTVGRGFVYACTNKSLWVLEGDAWVGSYLYPSSPPLPGYPTKIFNFPYTHDSTRAFFVKDRLILTQQGYVWDEAPPSPLSPTVTLNTADALYFAGDSVRWVGAVEHPNGIFLAASSVTGSTIYSVGLDTTGALPVLAAPAVAAEFPLGEELRFVSTYLGAYILLGTSLGFRVGTISNSQIGYGPITEAPIPSGQFAKFGRFVYYPTEDAGQDRSGVVRVDLSMMDETGRPAWARDRRIPAGGNPVRAVAVSVTGAVRMAASLGTGSSDKVQLYTDADTYEESGFLSTGWIRFGTTEKKYFDAVTLQMDPGWEGKITVTSLDDDGVVFLVGTTTQASGSTIQFSVDPPGPSSTIQLGFTLSATDDGLGSPVMESWQLRALPAVTRQRLIRVQLLDFDFERDPYGVPYGYEGYAIARWKSLEEQARDGWPFTFQDLYTGETFRVVLEQVSFSQTSPPARASGFGGIVDLTMRVIG